MLGPRKSKTLFLPQHLELKALATRAQKSVIVPPTAVEEASPTTTVGWMEEWEAASSVC